MRDLITWMRDDRVALSQRYGSAPIPCADGMLAPEDELLPVAVERAVTVSGATFIRMNQPAPTKCNLCDALAGPWSMVLPVLPEPDERNAVIWLCDRHAAVVMMHWRETP